MNWQQAFRPVPKLAAGVLMACALVSCGSNPATGGRNVVFSTMDSEVEQSRRWYDEIIRYYGLYEDQAIQEYVNNVGQRIARNSDLPDMKWTFVVIDEGS